MQATMNRLEGLKNENILQLTCVYGDLTNNVLKKIAPNFLHITDVAQLQLDNIREKLNNNTQLLAATMNAEQLAYKNDAFSTIILYFLLHEMPKGARRNTLSESLRVLSVGGSLIYAEYGALPSKHLLYRFLPSRWLLTWLEPFLSDYWQEDIFALLNDLGQAHNKSVEISSHHDFFFGFYRVTEFRVIAINPQ